MFSKNWTKWVKYDALKIQSCKTEFLHSTIKCLIFSSLKEDYLNRYFDVQMVCTLHLNNKVFIFNCDDLMVSSIGILQCWVLNKQNDTDSNYYVRELLIVNVA